MNGEVFYPDGGGRHHLRLCFTSTPAEMIERGIAGLASVLNDYSPEQRVSGTIPLAR